MLYQPSSCCSVYKLHARIARTPILNDRNGLKARNHSGHENSCPKTGRRGQGKPPRSLGSFDPPDHCAGSASKAAASAA